MTKLPTFGDLEATLEEFGYIQRRQSNRQVFEHPEGGLVIVLPKMHSKTTISAMHQRMVESTVRDDEVVSWDDFQFYLEHGKRREDFIKKGDRLLWRVPGMERIVKVVAASTEEDGVVIIKQKSAFSPCPVSQLRKEEAVES